MTDYLTPTQVDRLVTTRGFVYRDRALLLSALAAPLPVFGEEVHPTLSDKAAALMIAINRDHPLLDGNKRLSWYLAVAFLYLNGRLLTAPDPVSADAVIRAVAAGSVSHAELRRWIAGHTHPRAST